MARHHKRHYSGSKSRRRSSGRHKSYPKGKCAEPLNTLIDLTAGLAMGTYAYHKEKQNHYSQRGVPNPYTYSAIDFATGQHKSFGQSLARNSLLAAAGSFDDPEPVPSTPTYTPPVLKMKIRRPAPNRWRDYCEDGSAYGLDPMDYGSADAYADALAEAKGEAISAESVWSDSAVESVPSSPSPEKKKTATKPAYNTWRNYCEDGSAYGLDPLDYSSADDYQDALNAAKAGECITSTARPVAEQPKTTTAKVATREIRMSPTTHTAGECKHTWRKYARDGSQYGLYPEDFGSADDYEDALAKAEKRND